MGERPGLREQKKRRTRQALVEAALRLFVAQGYDKTTVAQIAEAAHVSYTTFFNYFATKDEVVFADDDLYDGLLRAAFAAPQPGETPADLLLRAILELGAAPVWSFPLDHELTGVRSRLIAEVPALRAAALVRNATLQQRLAVLLRGAFPEISIIHAAALTGAVTGAVDAVLTSAATAEPSQAIPGAIRQAATTALRGHLSQRSS
ncbi:TetR/AcrR family transcriptional regulator [Nocardia testacea]|uniref:TetR/AcrR family transcriptional regulator n=1 Tax=Nocardia testacea TaxID=248551 RepID=UPI0033D8C774